MLRVGLTGSLGSGKSTVAEYLRELGADVIEADELGRSLMQPGQKVYAEIVRIFGPEVVNDDGSLNRSKLANLAFSQGRLQDLNSIVHPATIEAQRKWMRDVFAHNPAAIAVVVSALVFEVERDARARGESDAVLADWKRRFDRIVVVTAPDDFKVARYVARTDPKGHNRSAAEADARARLAHQIPDAQKAARADYVLENAGDRENLRQQVESLWLRLKAESNKSGENEYLK
ncbi:MAG: dephospho-CoA kinase [Acidobacteriota bacterium]|nr:dephospho-CoA kinase [Acidobacteriota bacterium]